MSRTRALTLGFALALATTARSARSQPAAGAPVAPPKADGPGAPPEKGAPPSQPAAGTPATPPAPGCRVISLVTDANDPFADRIRVELLAVGYAVESAPEFEPGRPLGECVRAVVRVEVARRRVELWTAERGQAQFRASVFAEAGGPSDDETLAVRAAEDLRGYVTPDGLVIVRPAGATPTRAAGGPAPAGPEGRPFVAGAGLGVGLQPGGGGSAGLFVTLHGRWMAHPRFGVGVLAGLPLVPSKVSREAGEATLRPFLVGAEGYVRLTPPASRFDAGVGAGVLFASIAMSGRAREPYVSADDTLATALPFLSAELAPRITDRVRVYAGALAGTTAPKVGVRFAGQRVTDWGAPLVMLSAGASVEF